VVLCFSDFFFVFGVSRWVGFGVPITFLAADFTAFSALKDFLFFFGMDEQSLRSASITIQKELPGNGRARFL
jgi:hypothetical protein